MLKYKVEVEILEIQDWTCSSGSDMPYPPDQWGSDSEEEDDMPSF